MPRRTRRISRRKMNQGDSQPAPIQHTTYLPEGYHGPAYQLEDGRTLFVGRWIIPSQWAILYMPMGNEPERFSSPELPVVESKQIAVSNLMKYALHKRILKVQ